MASNLFGSNSFTDEITSPGQAKACIEYLAYNEHRFTQELQDNGTSYDDIMAQVKQLWDNLSEACKRVGYTDSLLQGKQAQFAN